MNAKRERERIKLLHLFGYMKPFWNFKKIGDLWLLCAADRCGHKRRVHAKSICPLDDEGFNPACKLINEVCLYRNTRYYDLKSCYTQPVTYQYSGAPNRSPMREIRDKQRLLAGTQHGEIESFNYVQIRTLNCNLLVFFCINSTEMNVFYFCHK
jgi:hypothetical protein